MINMDNDSATPTSEVSENLQPENVDESVLSGEELAKFTTMNPFIIYEEDGKVKVAILEGLRTDQMRGAFFTIRKQGVRKGEKGYKAKATLDATPLVPVFALVEASLVDKMLVSPAALAIGMEALKSLDPAPPTSKLVDMLVEEYVEAAPIEREFFLPAVEDTTQTDGTNESNTITEETTMNEQKGTAEPSLEVEEVIAEPIVLGTDGVHVADKVEPKDMEPNGLDPESPNFVGVSTEPLTTESQVPPNEVHTEPTVVPGKVVEDPQLDTTNTDIKDSEPIAVEPLPPAFPPIDPMGVVLPRGVSFE